MWSCVNRDFALDWVGMEMEFDDPDLRRLAADPQFTRGCPQTVVSRYRRLIGFIDSARDERDLRQMRSLHFEKLKGERQHQYSLRLNDQWRLIVEIRGEGPRKRIGVIEIVDYH